MVLRGLRLSAASGLWPLQAASQRTAIPANASPHFLKAGTRSARAGFDQMLLTQVDDLPWPGMLPVGHLVA